MNLPLHLGWLGALEAGAIALLIGLLVFAAFHAMARQWAWGEGHSIGWACLVAVAIGAGIDLWHLFYMGIARLESPVYARIVLQRIHDPNGLGARAVMEVLGALTGVALGWILAHGRKADPARQPGD